MVDDPEFDPEDSGARKSFWEHVQDLRTALIRSVIALGVAVMICLLITPQIVNVLEYPLRRMHMFEKPQPSVTLEIGTSKFGPFAVTREQFAALPPGTAPHAVFQVGTMKIGDEQVVTLKLDPNAKVDADMEVRLHNLSPGEAFFVAFRVALYAAIIVSAPFWVYFIGGFIVPAFKRKERTAIFAWVGWGVFLGAVGIVLTYYLLLPVALRASVKYSQMLGFNAFDWRADEYISFVCKFLLGMGIGFQFPLLVLFLVKLGILTHKQLAHYRRHVIVLALILGAVLTTPEPITQIAMAVPLYVLYEICIWISWYWDRLKRKRGEFVDV